MEYLCNGEGGWTVGRYDQLGHGWFCHIGRGRE